MKKELTNEHSRAKRTELTIAGRKFSVWYKDADSYLGSKDGLNARFAEAGIFRKICVSLLNVFETKNSICALDVGANVGIMSLVLAQLSQNREITAPLSKIVSFEPDPSAFECLEANAQFFPGLIFPVHGALGESSGTLPFMKALATSSASHVITDENFTNLANEFVNVERLDFHVEKLMLPSVGLIKIDVEGQEKAVLAGAARTIEKFNPWIYLEFNSWTLSAYGGINPRDFIDYLLDSFQIVSVVNKTTGTYAPIKSKLEALAFLHDNFVLHGCVDDLVLRSI